MWPSLWLGDYLITTHHSDSKDQVDHENLEPWAKSVRWIRLEVLKVEGGTVDDNEGLVEFRVSYQDRKRFKSIHKKSIFKREDGSWVYLGERKNNEPTCAKLKNTYLYV